MQGETEDGYRDETASVETRVDDLLARMTVEEKAAQLGSVNADRLLEDGSLDRERAETLLADGIGHLTRLGGEGDLPPREAAAITNEIQSILADTRLGIPAIPHEECLSGYMGPEGTTFPQAIGLASTWSPELVEEITATIREQLRAIGTAHALSPVLDVARDLRWGRVEETFGEDPYLVAEMANGYVSGLQGPTPEEGISATVKHFAGHGASEGGKNRASVNVGPRELREVHLFPFEAAIRVAGAASVMNAYHDIDGVPCARSEWLLTDVLRGELGFDGTVVSDYYSVAYLRSEHGVAATEREAGTMALEAGIDVELPYTDCYGERLVEAIEAGELAEETLDQAVRRVLAAKFRTGLFDDPTVDAEAAPDAFGTETQTELTTRAARQSAVLLKNEDGLLPLGDDVDSVAVVGPKADNAQELLGDYAYPAHYPAEEISFEATTPLEAIEERAGDGLDVAYERGCTTTGPDTGEFDPAATATADADVGLVFVGARSAVDFSGSDEEKRSRPSVPTSGEGCDVVDLDLPGVQRELVRRLSETGTPLVVVVVSGKPHSMEWIADEIPAVLQAWLPGERGGRGIVDVLFGDHDPGGRLPVSVPRSVGQLPVHYNRKPNTMHKEYVFTESSPLYPFGHGLSYAAFEYGDLSLSAETVDPLGTLTADVSVRNASDRTGYEVVQLYVRAQSPSQTRPVQELKGFRRIRLDPGERKRVTFDLSATQFAFHDEEMNLTVEAGTYELRIGRSSEEIVTRATVDVAGTKRVPATGRRYFTETRVGDDG